MLRHWKNCASPVFVGCKMVKKAKVGRPEIPPRERMVATGISIPASVRLQLEEIVTETGEGRSEVVVKILTSGIDRRAKLIRKRKKKEHGHGSGSN